jgi:putative membrane protein
MRFGYVVVAIISAAIVVFAFQNGAPVSVRFLAWTVPEVSTAAVILFALVSGLIIAAIPLWIQRWRLRARVRALEQQVRQLETAVAERDKALLAPRPSANPRGAAPDVSSA